MSEQSPFAPFETPTPSPPTQPEKPKRKNRSKNTAPEGVSILSPEHPANTVPRQKRKKTETKPSLKFDLQTILRAAAGLNEDDLTTFEKIVGLLSEAGKPGRERLLAAIEKIFA